MTRKLFAFGIILMFAFMLYAQGDTAVRINGFLIDNACATAHVKDKEFAAFVKKHKTSCALMPNCAGAGFAVLSDEGKLYKLDVAGNKSAEELLKSTETKMGVAVAVEGTIDGDTVHVSKLTEATRTE